MKMAKETAVGHVDPTEIELNKLQKSPFQKVISTVLTVLLVLSTVITAFYVYANYTYAPLYVDGHSMKPTLNDYSASNMYELGYMGTTKRAKNNLKRFDIAIYSFGGPSGVIKRVIGLPLETIKITREEERDFVYVKEIGALDFTLLEENYLAASNINKTYLNSWIGDYVITLADDEYFMLGDNRASSNDSRYIGPIKYAQLLGRLKIIYGVEIKATKPEDEDKRVIYAPREWRFY